MKACEGKATDELSEEVVDGKTKGATYSHALKIRAAVNWGFTRDY
jgi:hypothetical protein